MNCYFKKSCFRGSIKEEPDSEPRKSVQFSDGIKPGEGTSPSGGEDLSSPPPTPKQIVKGKRFKKIKIPKQVKVPKKKKVKVKVIRQQVQELESDEEEDNLPPPPPPPGSPPPHVFPARIKPPVLNNIRPNLMPNTLPLQGTTGYPNTGMYHPLVGTPMPHHAHHSRPMTTHYQLQTPHPCPPVTPHGGYNSPLVIPPGKLIISVRSL